MRSGISRRTALKLAGLGAAGVCLPPGLPAAHAGLSRPARDQLGALSPIDRSISEPAPGRYSGNDPGRAHPALWDKHGWLQSHGPVPEPAQHVPLAIVGGGMSGLASAWLLARHHPVVLEQAPRFGGNARGESWRGVDYSIGAAYFVQPDRGSPLERFVRELRLERVVRGRTDEDPVVLHGQRMRGFWEGASDPARRDEFRRLGRYFRDVLEERNGRLYPEIPVISAAGRTHVDALDRVTFRQHLQQVAGGALHPHADTAIEHFCWSSLGGGAGEVSAACGLNFYAAEFARLMVCEGGNAAVADALIERIARVVPRERLRPGSLVVDVAVRSDGVRVTYADTGGALRSLLARCVILACPKFVAARLIDDLDGRRRAAIARLQYRAYLVANVLLTRPVADDFYDLFLLGDGTAAADPLEGAAARGVTDVVLGSYARPRRDRAVLTLYRALPHPGGRALLLADDSYARYRAQFEEQIVREILPLVGCSPRDVAELRLARWGHPLPLAQPGLIADRVPEELRRPHRGRVFFVEQDNWALPAFETAVGEALHFAPLVERALARR